MATLSLTGLYNYRADILDNFELPAGVESKVLFPLLLADTSDLELLYPSPDVLKMLIGVWSRSMSYKWEHLYATTIAEYNPIENYDRKEDWDVSARGTAAANTSQSNRGKTAPSGSDTELREVAGYDSGTMAQSERVTQTAGITTESESSGNGTSTENTTNAEHRTGRAHGNIGVTTTQQMLESERNISDFSIYNVIIKDFTTRFCLEVY